MEPILVIYHDNCADGFASYMIAKAIFGERAEYVPCNYNSYKIKTYDSTCSLEYKGKDVFLNARELVYIVDFSFKRKELNLIADTTTQSIIVLDHHKTARAELMESDENGYWHKHLELHSKIEVLFDMSRSGCHLMWDRHNDHDNPMPTFVHLIGLRDVWQHKGTSYERAAEAMNMYIGLIGYNAEAWEKLWSEEFVHHEALPKGFAILDFFNQKVKEATEHAMTITLIGGIKYAVVNAPYWMASELGNKLAESADYAVIWSYANDRSVIASLRSIGTKCDVSAIAKRYNGGGHANAAGCKFVDFADFQAAFLGS